MSIASLRPPSAPDQVSLAHDVLVEAQQPDYPMALRCGLLMPSLLLLAGVIGVNREVQGSTPKGISTTIWASGMGVLGERVKMRGLMLLGGI